MRNPGLDLLRLVAVLLVLGRHMPICPATENEVLQIVARGWHTGGWVGVDLFFVLSGFLVSGLLFKEYQRTAKFDLKRFLIRRGFKIYPPFWGLLIVSIPVFGHTIHLTAEQIFAEAFFFQNYVHGVWAHTWSLAVEEHFYFGLAGLFFLAFRVCRAKNFSWIPEAFLTIAGVCLTLRLLNWHLNPLPSQRDVFQTHLRVDSLFFGVYLSYFYHFKPEHIPLARWSTHTLIAAGVVLLSPAFIFPTERYRFITVFGFIFFYSGSGFLLVAALRLVTVKSSLARSCAALGAASYSIYLWHIPFELWGLLVLHRTTGLASWRMDVVVYFLGAGLLGYAASRLVETPMLRLRNKLFPSASEVKKAL